VIRNSFIVCNFTKIMAYELEKELRNTVKEAYKRGFIEEEIRYELRKKGLSLNLINKILTEVKPKITIKTIFFILAIILIILGLIIAITFIKPGVKACTSSECFIKKANSCEEATFSQELKGTIFDFRSHKECTITKRVILVSAQEPEEIRNRLEGTSMTCYHQKNQFNPDLVNTLSKGIQDCRGDLKSVIEILIASL